MGWPIHRDFVAELANKGIANIAVVAPAFSSDCVETLEEINEEIAESFSKLEEKTFFIFMFK